jgi:DNA-binding transcriptional LysR family regulator
MRRTAPKSGRTDQAGVDVNAMLLFYEVANSGSINQAALLLKVPKATISRKLRRLEQDVGAVLLKRGVQKLSLTDAGELLYGHCRRVLAEVQGARSALADAQSELSGTLHIATAFGLAPWVVPTLATFARKYPHVELVVDETYRWIDISEERYDLVIHLGQILNQTVPVRRFAKLTRGVYASPEHLASKHAPTEPAELAEHSCIMLQQQIDDGLWRLPNASGSVAKSLTPHVRVSDVIVARGLTLRGVGFAILPEAICRRDVEQGRLVRVLPNWEIPPLIPAATFLEHRYMPLRVRTFLDTLAAQFKAELDVEGVN